MSLDSIWLMICIFALLFMQLGFCMLEAGYVRTKNTINVVIKNSVDLTISLLAYILLGFGLMFGASTFGLFSLPESAYYSEVLMSHAPAEMILEILIFSLFCATTVTIVAGAAAERITFPAYVVCSLFLAALIFPLVGHWAWNGEPGSETAGWLKKLGFIDFSGATVVHSLGGWASLAVIIFLGPRTGRFPTTHSPEEATATLKPENIPLIAFGTLMLWVAWLGFNGAGFLAYDERIPFIILNTLLCGSSALFTGMILSYIKTKKAAVLVMMNCGLGGLVASTAACHLLTPFQSIFLGVFAGITVIYGDLLLENFEIDDVVGAVPVHLGCGMLGTLTVPLFAEYADGSLLKHLLVQLAGVISIGMVTFCSVWLLFFFIKYFMQVRVSREAEEIGLNVAEHNARTPLLDVLVQMSEHNISKEYSQPIPVSQQEEAGHVATFYNDLIHKTSVLEKNNQKLANQLNNQRERDPLTQSLTRRAWLNKVTLALHDHNYGNLVSVVLIDVENFKHINHQHGETTADALLQHIHNCILRSASSEDDYIGRINGDCFGILLLDTSQIQGEAIAEELTKNLNSETFLYSDREIPFTVRSTAGSPQPDEQSEALLQRMERSLRSDDDGGK